MRYGITSLRGLTLKSMHTILEERVLEGGLLPWEPQIVGDSCERTLFITDEINDEFDEETWNDQSLAHRYAFLGADFDRFVTGDTVPIGMQPYDKDDMAFMARVDPQEYGIWTIRSVAPSPAIRVFGAFFQCDIFVALLTRRRMDLGGRGSRQWAQAREDAIVLWDRLFPEQSRLIGGNIHDFISEKAFVV